MSVNLSYIKPKNSLAFSAIKSDLALAIIERVRTIDGHEELRFDNELLIFICSCVENTVEHKKIDKKRLVLDIYSRIYTMADGDLGVIGKSIDFLIDNALVKKVPSITKYTSIFSNYFKSKF